MQMLAGIRPEDRRLTAGAFLTLFAVLSAHALLETARDSLFLSRIPAERLPWVYLAITLISLGITRLQASGRGFAGSRAALSMWMFVAGALTALLWIVVDRERPWTLYALYTWSGVVATMVVVRFWLLLSDLVTVTQGKRLYPLIGAGSTLGAIAGSGLAGVLVRVVETRHLVLVAGAVLVLASLAPPLLLRPPAATARAVDHMPGRGLLDDLRDVLHRPFVARVAAVVMLSAVTLTFVDWLFKQAVATHVDPANLGTFFATTYFSLNVASLIVQVAVVRVAIQKVGVHGALALLPILIIAGGAGLLLGGGLVAALVLKGGDGALRHSLHRTASELLYLPMTEELRKRVKTIIDVIGQRGGQALASVCILAATATGDVVLLVAVTTIALAALWAALAIRLRPHYVEVFRTTLRDASIETRVQFPELDLGSLEALIAALGSSDDEEVMAALTLLDAKGRTGLVPALILYHPSSAVTIRALELFTQAGRRDFLRLVPRLLRRSDPNVRAAALRALLASNGDDEGQCLQMALGDDSVLVRATALVGLARSGAEPGDALEKLRELAGCGEEQTRLAVAQAIARQPDNLFADLAVELACASDDPTVKRAVATAMQSMRGPALVSTLTRMLALRDVRPAAREALVAHGAEAFTHLTRALADESLPRAVRWHIPRTVSRFGGRRAARVLLERLAVEPDDTVRRKILSGLNKLRADDPSLPLDQRLLHEAVTRSVTKAFESIAWRLTLAEGAAEDPRRATAAHELLVSLLRDRERSRLERLFRKLGLLYPREDFGRIWRALRVGSPAARAGGRELLEHLLDEPLRGAVVALVDDAEDALRLDQAGPFLERAEMSYEDVLEQLLDEPSEVLCSLTVYHAGELGLLELEPKLRSLSGSRCSRTAQPAMLDGVLDRALTTLQSNQEGA